MSTLNDDLNTLERLARFPEGKPADPTKNMSPEDAAKWKAMNEEHGDKFKQAGYTSYKGDPYWLKAKYPGVADDGTPVRKGQEVLYWPRTKTMMVGEKAKAAWRKFQSEAEDEDMMGSRYAKSYRFPYVIQDIESDFRRKAITRMERDEMMEAVENARNDREAWDIVQQAKKYRSASTNEAQESKMSAFDELASLDMEMTAGSIPEVALDRDLAALEMHARSAAIDVAANEMIGKTIIEQMGGMRAMRMIGAKQIIWLKDGVGVKWPNKQPSKGNYFEVHLTPADEYDLEFYNVSVKGKKLVKKFRGVMWDQLAKLFEQQTGWYLRMASDQARTLLNLAKSAGDFDSGYEITVRFENPSALPIIKSILNGYSLKTEKKYRDYVVYTINADDSSLSHLKRTLRGLESDPSIESIHLEDARGRPVRFAGGDEQLAKFEEGEKADPTENMSEEDAKKWRLENLKNKDKFKTAAKADLKKWQAKVPDSEDPNTKNGKALKAFWDWTRGELTEASDLDGALEMAAWDLGYQGRKLSFAPGLELLAKIRKVNITKEHADGKKDKGNEKTAAASFEEGSRVPDGWDSGHLTDDPEDDSLGEGSETPDGSGNQTKRAAKPVESVPMYALVINNNTLFGATDNARDAYIWSYWSSGDRKLIEDDLRDQARVVDLYNVPLPLAETLADVGTRASHLTSPAAYRLAKPYMKDKGFKLAAQDKEAGSGLYGHTKRVQADCDSCIRKAQKAAATIARSVYAKNAKVAEFLSTHAKRADSLPAHILVSALGEIGPKVAAEMKRTARLEELRAQRGVQAVSGVPVVGEDKDDEKTNKTARSYGLYGFTDKVASLGLSACSEMRAEAGRLASGLHRRRAAQHQHITNYFETHGKTADCKYSRILSASYPEAGSKMASEPVPRTVNAWLEWDED